MRAGSVIAVDGKTMRGSESRKRNAIHIVNARAMEDNAESAAAGIRFPYG
ncbi:MAG: hypothetical protein LBD78_10020 [Spirochaetaceae bacterium]|nr:hypothetical protein [Spirochaetaceae bacterium]